jgi:hypothetical protein
MELGSQDTASDNGERCHSRKGVSVIENRSQNVRIGVSFRENRHL